MLEKIYIYQILNIFSKKFISKNNSKKSKKNYKNPKTIKNKKIKTQKIKVK